MQEVEGISNGKDYIQFYLKLLLESTNIVNQNSLPVSDLIPYDEDMLSTITNTEVDTIRGAMRVFKELKMLAIYDDNAIFKREVKRFMLSANESTERINKRAGRNKGGNNIKSSAIEEQTTTEKTSKDRENERKINFGAAAEKIYSDYPRKEGKAEGFRHLSSYLTLGKNIKGLDKVKYNHHQIRIAVQEYALECKEQQRETIHIKLFSTFLNQDLLDWVERTNTIYENLMQQHYGDEWQKLKFIYVG